MVLVILASLYGNTAAKKVLKFKADATRFEPENALTDIMVVYRFLSRKLEIEQLAREGRVPFARCQVITDDTGLAGILSSFEGESVRSEQLATMHRTHMNLSAKIERLFPELPLEDPDDAAGTAKTALSSVDDDVAP